MSDDKLQEEGKTSKEAKQESCKILMKRAKTLICLNLFDNTKWKWPIPILHRPLSCTPSTTRADEHNWQFCPRQQSSNKSLPWFNTKYFMACFGEQIYLRSSDFWTIQKCINNFYTCQYKPRRKTLGWYNTKNITWIVFFCVSVK